MIQVVSVFGALAILVAYSANQLQWIGPPSLSYALLNFLGAAMLSVVAILEQQWGFLLLEGVWTLVSFLAAAKLIFSSHHSISHED